MLGRECNIMGKSIYATEKQKSTLRRLFKYLDLFPVDDIDMLTKQEAEIYIRRLEKEKEELSCSECCKIINFLDYYKKRRS